ncbi:MAG: hypothetical protein M3Q65_02545, partial [Chloroflexota bacterium]|nr:hypothetical protein [Chloroflexota bacterium]
MAFPPCPAGRSIAGHRRHDNAPRGAGQPAVAVLQGLFKFSDRIVIVRADRAARGTPEAGTTGAAPGYVVAGAHWL